ncbi:hypothetical protein GGR55DRAFT_237840 [Xylaria sp. FL0064]|nr:hypothetical protein GGR55DRAFT_237840 [Xylaria sp. FL0064]
MDVSTASESNSDSDSNDTFSTPPTNDNIHVKNVLAFVVWRDARGESRCLSDLSLSLLCTPSTKKALIRLQATTRLKKGPAKPCIYLFIKPEQICTVTYVSGEDDIDRGEEELHGLAREKLNASTHVLRFELSSPATFVVPNEHPFRYFRAGSQAVWTAWKAFARDTHCFFIHFPMTVLSKARLLSFCQSASSHGTLASLNDNIASLYGGKGGKVVDPNGDDEDQVSTNARGPSDENTAPPAYEEHVTAGPSLSAIGPPLCLSPNPDIQRGQKRRRRDSTSPIREGTATCEKGNQADDRILDAILGLQRTIYETKAANEASLSKIMTKIEEIEGRFKRLEEEQKNLVDEVRSHMAPLWDELDTRLQSQEDREHVHIRDVIEEVVDENIKEKMAEAVDEYFKNDDEGQNLVHKVLGERIQEETRDFLQNQRFTGHFIINNETPPNINT